MKCHLQCAEQQVASSNITEYCACYAKLLSRVILVTYGTLFMRGATGVILQHHQILRLPRKVTVMTDPCHIYETLFTMRGTTGVILQHHRILRLPRKMTVMTGPRHIGNVIYNARNNRWHPPTSPNTAPATQNDCHD